MGNFIYGSLVFSFSFFSPLTLTLFSPLELGILIQNFHFPTYEGCSILRGYLISSLEFRKDRYFRDSSESNVLCIQHIVCMYICVCVCVRVLMKTMCPPGYHHNGFVYIYIHINHLCKINLKNQQLSVSKGGSRVNI